MPGEYSQEALQQHFAQINKRLADIEHQLKRLSDNVGLPYATFSEQFEVPEEVAQLAASGDRIGAVKRLRELTGASLEQARDIVAGL